MTAIHASDRVTGVQLDHDEVLPADVVILAVGVRPETTLARQIGVELGTTGAIRVDQTMRTNLPGVYAVGDVAESYCLITGKPLSMLMIFLRKAIPSIPGMRISETITPA